MNSFFLISLFSSSSCLVTLFSYAFFFVLTLSWFLLCDLLVFGRTASYSPLIVEPKCYLQVKSSFCWVWAESRVFSLFLNSFIDFPMLSLDHFFFIWDNWIWGCSASFEVFYVYWVFFHLNNLFIQLFPLFFFFW